MTATLRMVLGVLLLTIVAAAGGAWVGMQYGLHREQPVSGLDEFLHHQLDLTPEQEQQISSLEAEFAKHRAALEQTMSAANRDLATALQREHVYGPDAKGAIERFHLAAASFQEETIKHILEMRSVLTPDQAQQFDAIVVEALTSDAP